MSVLCLVLDSDPPVESWRETYNSHRLVWQRCLDVCPWIEGFLVRSVPDLPVAVQVQDKLVLVRGEEGFKTVLHKLTTAIEVLLGDQEFVIQTGLSSLYDFRLLRSRTVASGLYAGHVNGEGYVSGAGILLSNDAARLLVEGRNEGTSGWQDIDIRDILHARGIEPKHEEMFIYNYAKGPEQLEVGRHLCYRFRDYDDPYRATERAVLHDVFERLYG